MLFIGHYWEIYLNTTTEDYDYREKTIEIYATSLEEAEKKDKEYWAWHREPAWFEDILIDTHTASISTFLDREMPYFNAA